MECLPPVCALLLWTASMVTHRHSESRHQCPSCAVADGGSPVRGLIAGNRSNALGKRAYCTDAKGWPELNATGRFEEGVKKITRRNKYPLGCRSYIT